MTFKNIELDFFVLVQRDCRRKAPSSVRAFFGGGSGETKRSSALQARGAAAALTEAAGVRGAMVHSMQTRSGPNNV